MKNKDISLVFRILLYFELFFFNGLLMFWIIYKCDRILIESLYDLVSYLGSGLIVLLNSFLLFNQNPRFKILKNLIIAKQGVLNFITAGLGLFLLAILQYSDWLYYPIPLGWTFNLYFIFNGFVISCALGFETSESKISFFSENESIGYSLKTGFQGRMKYLLLLILTLSFILSYFIVLNSKYLSPMLIFTVCLHSFLGSQELHNTSIKEEKHQISQRKSEKSRKDKLSSSIHHSAVWSANLFIFISLFYRAALEDDPRAFEASWNLLMNFFFGWGSFIGAFICIGLVLISIRKEKSIIYQIITTLSLLAITVIFNIFILAQVLLGFGFLLNLFLQLSGDRRSYAFYAWSNQLVWTLGLIATNFYGVLRDYFPIIIIILVFLIIFLNVMQLYFLYVRSSKKNKTISPILTNTNRED